MPVRVKNENFVGARALTDVADRERATVVERLKALMTATAIKIVPIESLNRNPRNTKTHPARQIALLAKNIEKFGIHSPIITDETAMILCGHARFEAAKIIGLDRVPTILLEGLSPHE